MGLAQYFKNLGQDLRNLFSLQTKHQPRYGHWQTALGDSVGRVLFEVDGHSIEFSYDRFTFMRPPSFISQQTSDGFVSTRIVNHPALDMDLFFSADCKTLDLPNDKLLSYLFDRVSFEQLPPEVYATLAHKLKDETYNPKSGYGILVDQGIHPLDAQILLEHFSEEVRVNSAGASKNTVYHVRAGNQQKIVKFVPRKNEAEIECLVNYHFSRHPLLGKYVPQSDQMVPEEIRMGDTLSYMLVQQDVRSSQTDSVDRILMDGTPKQLDAYLQYWMKTLAQIHVYGTHVMDTVGNTQKALRLTKTKDQERLENSALCVDSTLRADLVAEDIETTPEFIHQDIRAENRVGRYAIDWGHAGRGNCLLDVARVLMDHRAQRFGMFTDVEYQRHIGTYLQEKAALSHRLEPVTRTEVEHALQDFRKISLLYVQSQGPYLMQRGNWTAQDRKSVVFMTAQHAILEREFNRSRHFYFPACLETATVSNKA